MVIHTVIDSLCSRHIRFTCDESSWRSFHPHDRQENWREARNSYNGADVEDPVEINARLKDQHSKRNDSDRHTYNAPVFEVDEVVLVFSVLPMDWTLITRPDTVLCDLISANHVFCAAMTANDTDTLTVSVITNLVSGDQCRFLSFTT